MTSSEIFKSKLTSSILAIALLAILIPQGASAQDSRAPEIKIFNDEEVTSFLAFDEWYTGGGTLAVGDVGTDGIVEIIVGSGFNVAPKVKIFRQDGSLINEFLAYAPNFGRGITVALGDLDGDGRNEIITGTKFGGGPHIRIFDSLGNLKFGQGFFAYNPGFRGGVNIACGDIDGDGRDEIITGAGPTGGPHVRVFDAYGNIEKEFFAFDQEDITGVTVAAGDLDGDNIEDIIVGRQGIGPSTVKVFSAHSPIEEIIFFNAFIEDYQGGVTVSSGDVNGDGYEEIGVTVNGNGGPHVRYFNLYGQEVKSFFAFEEEYRGGVQIASANIDDDPAEESVVMANKKLLQSSQPGKFIDVNLSEQHLYAYQDGVLLRDYPVSTGTYQFPTPPGDYSVLRKLEWHDYAWTYGPDNPNNYSLPDVQYNLMFRPHYYIHYAYWHNNFGNRMSHGCVNTGFEDAKWTFNWAELGTPVEVHY